MPSSAVQRRKETSPIHPPSLLWGPGMEHQRGQIYASFQRRVQFGSPPFVTLHMSWSQLWIGNRFPLARASVKVIY